MRIRSRPATRILPRERTRCANNRDNQKQRCGGCPSDPVEVLRDRQPDRGDDHSQPGRNPLCDREPRTCVSGGQDESSEREKHAHIMPALACCRHGSIAVQAVISGFRCCTKGCRERRHRGWACSEGSLVAGGARRWCVVGNGRWPGRFRHGCRTTLG